MIGNLIRYYLKPVKSYCNLANFRYKWRKHNSHNDTLPNNLFPIDKVKVGKGTYATLNIYSYRNKEEMLIIGNYCSIASDVIFLLSGEHDFERITSFPFPEKEFGIEADALSNGPIIVEDDVWIGVGSIILSGVRIGKGSVIGAGSIVTKDIPPYSIYAGGRIIRRRFTEDIIEKLMSIDFEKIDRNVLNKYKYYCTTKIDRTNIDVVLECFHKVSNKKADY